MIHWSSVLSVESYELYEKGDYEGAIESISRPARPRASIPRRCSTTSPATRLFADRRDDAVAHLGEALRLNPGMVELARGDSDFDSLRQDEEFRALVS